MNNEINEGKNVLEQKPTNNNPLMENKNEKNNKVGLIIALVILLLAAVGFICYDKFINKEELPVPTATPTPMKTDTPEIIEIKEGDFKEIELTESNKIVKIGDNSFKIKISNDDCDTCAGDLYINDTAIMEGDFSNINVSAKKVYVTHDFIFFVSSGQSFSVEDEIYSEWIPYAINSNGDKIKIANKYQLRNIRFENEEVLATGVTHFDEFDDIPTPIELVIKYYNNTITVEPKK